MFFNVTFHRKLTVKFTDNLFPSEIHNQFTDKLKMYTKIFWFYLQVCDFEKVYISNKE